MNIDRIPVYRVNAHKDKHTETEKELTNAIGKIFLNADDSGILTLWLKFII